MRWTLAGALALLVMESSAPPADACGVKLVLKTSTPRKDIARSSNPSRLLLVGTPPHRLRRELAAAGHDVEVAPSLAEAKRGSYAVVVVDDKQAKETHAKFPDAVVVIRSDDVTADISSIERKVARRPVRAQESRPVVAMRRSRTPIAAGPRVKTRAVVTAKDPTQPSASVTTTAQPPEAEQPPAAKDPTQRSASATTTAPTPAEQPIKPSTTIAKAAAGLRDEIYFGLGQATVSRSASLDRAVLWLTENASVHVVLEGHADPSGDPDANMALSQGRAESVRDYLVAAGVDPSRLEIVPYGDTRLKYGRHDPRNRRVSLQPKP